MADKREDAVVRPETIRLGVEIPTPTIMMRNYFSTHLLWAARDMASKAAAIESTHTGDSLFDIEHRSYIVGSVVSAASFLEAMVNELFQDAYDGHGIRDDGYIAPLSARTIELMGGWWAESGEGSEPVLTKYQLLLLFAEQPELDKGAEPYQSAALLARLRNALVHYKSESVTAEVEHRFTKALRGKFLDNRLMAGSGNPWWPDHALGAGCAQWAFDSAKALADVVADALQITPNYRRHQATWFSP
jgi:hypothetical protein